MTGRSFLAILWAVLALGCGRSAPDATPEGALRLFLEKMETSESDPRAVRDAYGLLGLRARTNLKERADRASKEQGRRYEPHEMLAEGRFGLKFRPKSMATKIDGDNAFVEVRGDGTEELVTVHCRREGHTWRIEPDLPDAIAPQRRAPERTP